VAVKIGSNIESLRAQGTLSRISDRLSSVFERLSSGQRINRASDDAAGLAISSGLNARSRVYNQAVRNVADGISLLSIAEGAIKQLGEITIRQQELAEQAANGIYGTAQRASLNNEARALTSEYNRIIASTQFNGQNTFSNTQSTAVAIQHGYGSAESTGINANSFLTSTLTSVINGGTQEISRVEFSDTPYSDVFPMANVNPYYFTVDAPEEQFIVNLDFGYGYDMVNVVGRTQLVLDVSAANGDSQAISNIVSAALAATGRFSTNVTLGGGGYGVNITNVTAGAVAATDGAPYFSTSELQIGTNGSSSSATTIFASDIDLLSAASARTALTTLSARADSLRSGTGQLGAILSRLSVVSSVVSNRRNVLMEASARITDADIAEESSNLVKQQILQQSTAAILGQANLAPALALKLLTN